ncbi:MAG: Diaminopimelate epimerase [Candidatus Moanabacter tarae]|uniref:Diaminopimelate epimerase n=1 Tax=Candidatus Moanibacter tarae TaxID=2200854 RepID=A0A2Z4ANL6_9BACT|nr:MAG: Diaminopimelate epimerase [Candidatus Moanabacter tarae]|tara:strand:- start:83175 stop:84020 length:846 start_codon:yes stop_codon:yes gene_type:complete
MKFEKYHALGNDYLVLDATLQKHPPSKVTIERICHRNFGIGSDGILFGPLQSEEAEFGLQIFNPDGSEAEKSGNGLRIFARHLWDKGKVSVQPFNVMTSGGCVKCVVKERGSTITVDMGKVTFLSDKIPVSGPPREVLDEIIELNNETYRFYAASIGNPHCVLPLDEISSTKAKLIGPLLENHSLFPNRTNVQLLQILDRQNIRIEIWERGAGYTLASGSSSCAAAAVAIKMGAVDHRLIVHMPGGQLELDFSNQFDVQMTGPVTRIGSVEFAQEALGYNC